LFIFFFLFLLLLFKQSLTSSFRFHGYPGLCKLNGNPAACCVHGSPVFPHWHRLYVAQLEDALLSHGSAVAMPYFDWTSSFDHLPDLVTKATFFNSRSMEKETNPFFR
jgi:hypothetical protein